GVTLQSQEVREPKDFQGAFAMMAQQRPDVLLVLQDALTLQHRKQIIDFGLRERLPSMFVGKEWVQEGGLMAYGDSLPDRYRRAASFVVAGLARPGGNVTGVSILNVEVAPKRLELLREVLPAASIMGLLLNPTNPNAEAIARSLQAAAVTLGLKLHVLHASAEPDLDRAVASVRQVQAMALVIGSDPFFTTRSQQLAALTMRHAIPAIYQYREFTAAGGLMSYGGSLTDSYRLAGVYAGRILAGAKPADLPVQQSTKVELIINLKSARTLGLTVPLSLLGRADEVIE